MRKVLILDDGEDLLYAMQRLLSFYNLSVRVVKDSKAFKDEFESFKPDIAIIDVLLPDGDGRQICKTLREDPSNKEVTLVLFSASPKHLTDFKKMGADGAIEKPFGISDFIHTINTAAQSRKIFLFNQKN
ncbi:MAG: two component transcriptional regulator, winged helix family [Chitinophagaceae bacterium]|nr:two component transcriptional regulator, winged helix family [Chitinophagaceae bacterium]